MLSIRWPFSRHAKPLFFDIPINVIYSESLESPESLYHPPTAMTERIRTTISLTPEAHEVFKRMADASNLSISRCMGDWLADTLDAAEMITLKMEDAKREPMRVVRELRAMVAGMASAVDESELLVRESRRMYGAQQRAAGAAPVPPPSSNTGVLSPSHSAKTVLKRASKVKRV